MSHNLPYLTSQKRVKTCLDKIKGASTPEQFNITFINETLDMKGGTATSLPPLLKKIGFIDPDGSPTEWYKEFRNPAISGQIAFKALKHAYSDLFEVNENAHKIGVNDLKDIVSQVTGLDHDNPIINHIIGTFKTIKGYASFEEPSVVRVIKPEQGENTSDDKNGHLPSLSPSQAGLNIGYNINLNLPATSDISVFNAIFTSLKEHLLKV